MYQERSHNRLIVASGLLPPSRGGTVSDVRLCVLKNMFYLQQQDWISRGQNYQQVYCCMSQ